MAEILSDSEEDLKLCAKQINEGGLVAFPTETVYGLGSRLEDNALKGIFAAKHRPYSDPLICHFDTAAHAKQYLLLNPVESELFDKLACKFWPGPMTIVAPATHEVPPLVMAGTGCVGVRVPVHPIAHRFLELCGEPVAAPSANLFGHISPTTVDHVITDLGSTSNLKIISGGNATIGIESSVIRICNDTLTVLRPGFITAGQLEEISPGKVFASAAQNQKLASPGHETRHYAPNMPCILVKIQENGKEFPNDSVIIDFHRKLSSVSSKCLRYFDLSPIGSVAEAIKNVYNILREAENTPGAKICLIADITQSGLSDEHDQQLVDSLRDRLLRSASHQTDIYKL